MRLLAIVLALFACGCAARDPLAGARGVLLAQESAWNRGDLEGFMSGYTESAATSFSSDSGTVFGWEQLLARYRARYPDGKAMGKLAFSNLKLTPLGAKAVLAIGSWQLEREKDRPAGVFSVVLVEGPEGWKIVHDHTSMVPAAERS